MTDWGTPTGTSTLDDHHTQHEDGGGDEVDVTGLSGLLADDQHVLDTEVVSAIEAASPLTLPAFTLGGTMDANSQALINVEDLDLGTESAWGTFSATLTAANAGTAWLIKSKDTSDILRPRLGLSGGVDTAVWGWEYSTHTGIVLSGALDANAQDIINTGTITASSSIWWHEYILPASAFSQGASGATTLAPNANTLGGWLLDRDVALEELNSTSHIEDDWDGASDPIVEIYFEVNVDNTLGADTDTVDIQVIFRYKGDAETAIKTQTVVDAVVIGKSAQYKQFKATITLDWDLGGNVLEVRDVVSIAAGLVAASSEVTNIILNFAEFKYHTDKPAPEV